MTKTRYGLCVLALTATASLAVARLENVSLSRGTACLPAGILEGRALLRQSNTYDAAHAARTPLTPNSPSPQNVRLDPRKSPLALPLTFEANIGQAAPRIQFLARSHRLSFLLTSDGIDVQSVNPARHDSNPEPLKITFGNADSNARIRPQRRLAWKG